MKAREEKQWRSLKQAGQLLHTRKFSSPHVDLLVRELDVILADVQRCFDRQFETVKECRGLTEYIAHLRTELRELHMYRIARHGPSLMKWAPKSEAALRLPHITVGHARLVAAARGMIAVVALKPTLFVRDAKFPKDFLTKFRAATRALEETVANSSKATQVLSRVTRDLGRALARGRRQLRMLDGALRPLLRDHPDFASLWRDVIRLPGKLGRPKKKKKRGQRPPPPPALDSPA